MKSDSMFRSQPLKKSLALLGLVICHTLTAHANEASESVSKAPLPLEDLRQFTQVYDHIRNAYVEEVDDETLLKNAIIGMLTQLDPHSAYLDESSFT